MKCLTTGVLSILAVTLLASSAWAQPPGGRQGRPGGPMGGQGQGGPGGQHAEFRPPMHPLEMALDANKDGEISAAEIENAAAALKKLDKNGDGKLAEDELQPEGPHGFGGRGQARPSGRGRGGFGQGGGFGGPGRGGPGGGPGRGGVEQGGRPGGPGHGGPGGPGGPGGVLVEQLMGFDTDKDGKITKEELSEGMRSVFEKGDTDQDGAISREEAEKLVEELGPPRGGRGGGRGGAGGTRPAGNERPQRPQ